MDAQTVGWLVAVAKGYGLAVSLALLAGIGLFVLVRQAIKKGFSLTLTVGPRR